MCSTMLKESNGRWTLSKRAASGTGCIYHKFIPTLSLDCHRDIDQLKIEKDTVVLYLVIVV